MKAHIDHYSGWIGETAPAVLNTVFDRMLTKAGFGILNFIFHHFEPQGYTGLWLLSESHLAIHTFPEEGKTYIELSSCNTMMYEQFLYLLAAYKHTEHE